MRQLRSLAAIAVLLNSAPASASTVWTWWAGAGVEYEYHIDSAWAAGDPSETRIEADPAGLEAIGFPYPPGGRIDSAFAQATQVGFGRTRQVMEGPELGFRNLTSDTVFGIFVLFTLFGDTNVNWPDDYRDTCDFGRVNARAVGSVAGLPGAEVSIETNLDRPADCYLTAYNDEIASYAEYITLAPGESSPMFRPTALVEIAVVPPPPAILALATGFAGLVALRGVPAGRRSRPS